MKIVIVNRAKNEAKLILEPLYQELDLSQNDSTAIQFDGDVLHIEINDGECLSLWIDAFLAIDANRQPQPEQ